MFKVLKRGLPTGQQLAMDPDYDPTEIVELTREEYLDFEFKISKVNYFFNEEEEREKIRKEYNIPESNLVWVLAEDEEPKGVEARWDELVQNEICDFCQAIYNCLGRIFIIEDHNTQPLKLKLQFDYSGDSKIHSVSFKTDSMMVGHGYTKLEAAKALFS